MNISRLKFAVIIIATVLVGAIAAIYLEHRPESKTYESYLNVLNWTSYIPDEIISDFEKEYNIKVNYGTYSSNEELLAKVSSAKSGTYDLVFPSDYMVDLMIRREMLEPLETDRLENAKNLNPKFLAQEYDPKNEFSLPFLLATTVVVYDAEKLDHISSYKDLLRPELENNLVLIDDQRMIIGAMLNAEGFEMNETSDVALKKSLEFFEELKPNVKAFDSDSPKTFLITEEVDAGIVWNAEALLAKEERPSLKIVYPVEGFGLSMDNYCLVKGGKNSDAAYKFIDFLLRPEVAEKIIDDYPYISPLSSVGTLSNAEISEILENGSYVKNVGADIKKFDKLWAKYK
ncbi:spermidine/putrescine ABC transporter substrate-binding protein [Candidatus Saccharibacteria bacterium]|nr:spermidine/putrescine ABC transporter substrate-binding protein [Candidatus Saccharibacteria bacterium]